MTVSYHDLHITAEGVPRVAISDLPYNVSVRCLRSTGWEVWHRPDDCGPDRLLAGEYAGPDMWLVLDVAGHVVCDSRPTELEESGP